MLGLVDTTSPATSSDPESVTEEIPEDDGRNVAVRTIVEAEQPLPPSHDIRVQNVKRIRDDAAKSRRSQKKSKKGVNSSANETQLAALLETASKYFQFKLKQEKIVATTATPSFVGELLADDNGDNSTMEAVEYLSSSQI
ncbi:Hypothetical protein PHPALM_18004 [Phytophthora palmivora]|uniref:Uncharacterized protein n=1 Tax=Phytophthora palmivora TaxID=4796 RepID=A0A2P4XKU1_9STRA|nr:Hypothetical protein PHPALM_18004 [Phytophthora palmivora]